MRRSTKTRCTLMQDCPAIAEGGVGGAESGFVEVGPVAVDDEGSVAAEFEQGRACGRSEP